MACWISSIIFRWHTFTSLRSYCVALRSSQDFQSGLFRSTYSIIYLSVLRKRRMCCRSPLKYVLFISPLKTYGVSPGGLEESHFLQCALGLSLCERRQSSVPFEMKDTMYFSFLPHNKKSIYFKCTCPLIDLINQNRQTSTVKI